ncbi:MAG: hypothetical protein J6C28_01140 [Bacilli bacterium]|nr:hypothetical protein [Bacilli bacterium]
MIYSKEELNLKTTGTIIFIDEDKYLIEEAIKSGWKSKTQLILEKKVITCINLLNKTLI